MELFFKLEAGYFAIALFVLLVTIFVTTRNFMARGIWKKALLIMTVIMSIFIGLHYFVTVSRIHKVEEVFNNGGKIICENRAIRKVSQSIVIEKSGDWVLENRMLSSENHSREFFTARCIENIDGVIVTNEEKK